MKVITSPESFAGADGPTIFLAGSIEQDTAVNWQQQVILSLEHLPGTIFNPRLAAWDASWVEDDPRFIEQVKWELAAMQQADMIMMHFEPATKSPITLLELGLYCGSGKLYVSCPAGFWRRGNVRIVCESHGVRMHETLQELVETVTATVGWITSRP